MYVAIKIALTKTSSNKIHREISFTIRLTFRRIGLSIDVLWSWILNLTYRHINETYFLLAMKFEIILIANVAFYHLYLIKSNNWGKKTRKIYRNPLWSRAAKITDQYLFVYMTFEWNFFCTFFNVKEKWLSCTYHSDSSWLTSN